LVHLPVHASWLNQIEIYFSIVQRKVLTPNDFTDLAEVQQRVLGFQCRYEQTTMPFDLGLHQSRSGRPAPATRPERPARRSSMTFTQEGALSVGWCRRRMPR
jgi:hypothetical protein